MRNQAGASAPALTRASVALMPLSLSAQSSPRREDEGMKDVSSGLSQEVTQQNGMIERFFCSKAECVWLHRFRDRDRLRPALVALIAKPTDGRPSNAPRRCGVSSVFAQLRPLIFPDTRSASGRKRFR